MSGTSTLISCTGKITLAELANLSTPPATATHIPIPHAAVVETLVETLSHRHIAVVDQEFAASKDDMEMFGVLDLETGFEGCRFAVGIRNSNNKRFRLACTVGLRVFVCHNLAFRGDYSPVLAKHSKHFSVEDALSIGVDRMQRNFEPMRRQVESWRAQQLSTEAAKLMIYRAFIDKPEAAQIPKGSMRKRNSNRGREPPSPVRPGASSPSGPRWEVVPLQSSAVPDVTSIKLSTPKLTREMLPASAPATYPNHSLKTVPGDGEILQSFSAPGNILAIQRSHDQSISSGTSKSGGNGRAGGN